MTQEQVLNDLTGIFRDVLDNDDIKISAATIAKDVEEWDSLSHIQLIVAIEKHFKIRFTTAEINSWKNVGEMCGTIAQKLNK